MVDLGSVAVGGVAAIAAAVAGVGYWSLAVQALVTAGCSTIAISLWMGWRPRLALDRQAARELWKFGAGQTGFTAINYWARNADDILIGRFVGPFELGLYSRAYQLMRLPLTQVSQVVGQVMFPVMARMQDDHQRVRRVYLDAVSAIALVAFPLMTGIAAASPELVPAVLGPRWSGAVVLLQILAVAGVPQSVGLTVGWIYQSQGRTDVMLRWGLGASALALLAFAIGVRWGAVGVASAYALQSVVLVVFSFRSAGRLIGLGVTPILRVVATPLVASVGMAVIVRTVGELGRGLVGDLVLGLVDVGVGGFVYVLAMLVLAPRGLTILRDVLRRPYRTSADISSAAS
jgi:PST family polysaccharide transporter